MSFGSLITSLWYVNLEHNVSGINALAMTTAAKLYNQHRNKAGNH